MSLSIITVTHRSARHLPAYVQSFLASGSGSSTAIEFIFVENSGDRDLTPLLQPLREAGFAVTLLETANDGFGAGCNAGAAVATGDILVFANPDLVFVDPLDDLDRLRGGWGTLRQDNATYGAYSFDAFLEHKTVLGELTRRYRRLTPPACDWAAKVFCVGALFGVDRALFTSVGCFDERFFLYHEEAELARRLQLSAGPPKYLDHLRVRHEGFGSQQTAWSTLDHECAGFLTYLDVVGVKRPLFVRMLVFLLLSPVSRKSRQRLAILVRQLVQRKRWKHGDA